MQPDSSTTLNKGSGIDVSVADEEGLGCSGTAGCSIQDDSDIFLSICCSTE